VLCCCKGSRQLTGADGADEEVAEVGAQLEQFGPEASAQCSAACCRGVMFRAAAAHSSRCHLGAALHLACIRPVTVPAFPLLL